MSNSGDNTPKLIIFSVLAGILILIAAAFGFAKTEIVSLPLKFEEFTDFQCPACAQYHPIIKQIVSEYTTDNLDYQFKNFPLTTIHENAYNSALAAQAAKKQGKFIEFGDLLFANQAKLTRNELIGYASSLGLDITKFTTDMDSTEVKAIVDADVAEANKRGANATPTFYINGQKVIFRDTDNPEEVLRKTINDKITLGLKQKAEAK